MAAAGMVSLPSGLLQQDSLPQVYWRGLEPRVRHDEIEQIGLASGSTASLDDRHVRVQRPSSMRRID
ncbi:MAG TPA: hypothetical protein VF778_06625, partial [Xanthobacteraceae bacterium]